MFRGSGSATPSRSISNAELGERVETSDEWIRTRTGIAARRVVNSDESLAELSGLAAERALDMAGWSADSLDLILLATSTPDDLFGSSPRLQARLGATNAVAFDRNGDLNAAIYYYEETVKLLNLVQGEEERAKNYQQRANLLRDELNKQEQARVRIEKAKRSAELERANFLMREAIEEEDSK